MPEDKDHNCTGPNCIYCQIAADERLSARTSSLAIVNEQALSRVRSLEQGNSAYQYDTTALQSGQVEQWKKLAFFDQLTGLSNIHVFMKELKYEVARAVRYKRPLTMAVLRLDHYQAFKNEFGPLGCEMAIKHVGKLLQDALREVDISARLQLEQFGMILPETNQAGGTIVAERLRQALAKTPLKLNALNIDLTCSVGIASFPKHGMDAEILLNSCLKAQTEAMNSGGNQVIAL